VFVKGHRARLTVGSTWRTGFLSREARISAALPTSVPAPALIETWEAEGWVILCFQDIEGTNPACLGGRRAAAGPRSPDRHDRGLDPKSHRGHRRRPRPEASNHWRQLASQPQSIALLPGLDDWVQDKHRPLPSWRRHQRPQRRGHAGSLRLRADNIVLKIDATFLRRLPHARIGAPWLDLAYFLPMVAMQGGPYPTRCFGGTRSPVSLNLRTYPQSSPGWRGSWPRRHPPPRPVSPPCRRFQLAQGQQAVRWLPRNENGGRSS